jgi:tripartite-type tricarboxylate transporter receptor subunit TctC
LQSEIREVMSQTDARVGLDKLGFETIASTPREMRDHIRTEYEVWSKVVHAANIQVR